MSFEERLGTAMRASTETLAPPVTELASRGLRRGQQLRRRRRLATGGLAAVLLLAAGTAATALVHRGDDASRTVVGGTGSCDGTPLTGVLPPWARDGFSDPYPAQPHVLSEHGRMAAILFGPLTSPTAPGRNNKVLWVTRSAVGAAGPLHIDAVLAGSGREVRRTVSGVGPSIVDLPEPGCWQLSLRWGQQRDTMDLDYGRP